MITSTGVLFGDSLRSNGIIDHLFYVFSFLFIQIGLHFCVCAIFYWTKRKSFHREFGNNVFKESNCFLVCAKRCAYIKIHIVAFAKCIFLLFIHQRRIIMLKRFFFFFAAEILVLVLVLLLYKDMKHETSMEAIERTILYLFFWILNSALRDDENDDTKMCAYVHCTFKGRLDALQFRNHVSIRFYLWIVNVCSLIYDQFSFGQLAWEFMLTNLIQRKSVDNDIDRIKWTTKHNTKNCFACNWSWIKSCRDWGSRTQEKQHDQLSKVYKSKEKFMHRMLCYFVVVFFFFISTNKIFQ